MEREGKTYLIYQSINQSINHQPTPPRLQKKWSNPYTDQVYFLFIIYIYLTISTLLYLTIL